MPEGYAHFQFRLHVCSPVAADSPFESDTLWGRIVCALYDGQEAEQRLAKSWVGDLQEQVKARDPNWQAPLIVSEGFQCDAKGIPWLPLPLLPSLDLQKRGQDKGLSRKELKRITRVRYPEFVRICQGELLEPEELLDLRNDEPSIAPALQPHLAMDRLTGTSLEGKLYMRALSTYSSFPRFSKALPHVGTLKLQAPLAIGTLRGTREAELPQVVFLLKLRRGEDRALIQSALERACQEGWGHAKSRGLGRVRFKGDLEPWQGPAGADAASWFVSLSYFCPATSDPTAGLWELNTKHPVPAQFVDDRRVRLRSGKEWHVKSLLRLTPGSCFRLERAAMREHYGRMIPDLLLKLRDGEGREMPSLFHYALAYSWPIRGQVDQEPVEKGVGL